MFFLLTNKREILDFTAEQLQYIPKILLLQEFENYVEILWDRLPNHLKTDPEVQRCHKIVWRGMISGAGLLNKTINALPFEVHIPGYQFYGPGTRLVKRLARGDRGINRLDAACREHDITYSGSNDLVDRHIADRVLAERARERITASDSTFGEKNNGIKNPKPTTTTQSPTTEITTNTPTYVDLCTLQYVDTVLVLHHRIFVTYQRYVWSIDINNAKYDGPYVLNSYMDFRPDNFSLSAAYQRPSGELVLFVHDVVYMVEYPSFKLKEYTPMINNADIEKYLMEQNDRNERGVKRTFDDENPDNKEIPLSLDIWREVLEQKHVILSLLQYDENNRGIRATPSPMYIGNLTLRFGRINNPPILRLETSTARLSIEKHCT
ncbi:hypothetical protein ALC57_08368 [Trachymyrmex cornetzi]|uniref:Phospholipase A2-like domain-containing protein n=1 Tax=Trachymyrmex cornetzi TaxID=471704 RepID=A0A151J7D3_9HYME|nr:hypothetical protein ALC57_08368 [Trachymyrmex cornetzi]